MSEPTLEELKEANRRLNRSCQELEAALLRMEGLQGIVSQLQTQSEQLGRIVKQESEEYRRSRRSTHYTYMEYTDQLPKDPSAKWDGPTVRLEYAIRILKKLPPWIIDFLGGL